MAIALGGSYLVAFWFVVQMRAGRPTAEPHAAGTLAMPSGGLPGTDLRSACVVWVSIPYAPPQFKDNKRWE